MSGMDKNFLQMVAQDLTDKLGSDLSHTAVVFPNKRASLFFNEYLAAQSERPVWAPTYLSIKDLFLSLTTRKAADPIELVCRLYKIYCEASGSDEQLDDFYFWGELLIADFDDADKNMAPTALLFKNLQELRDMDSFDFLSEEQSEAIRTFFNNISIENRTELKERFFSLWNNLGAIYTLFNDTLRQAEIGYEGAIYRNVVEDLQAELLPYEHLVFVGFNVLNKVEQTLFKKAMKAGKALFYWDYDISYTQPQPGMPRINEAGEFILRNLSMFPNELDATCFDRLRKPKQVKYIAATTENAQARFIPFWYESLPHTEGLREKDNAVVLCNESLLGAALHAMPADVQHVNITMGFPLAQTPISSLVGALVELYTNGYNSEQGVFHISAVLSVLHHPYTRQLAGAEVRQLERALGRKNIYSPLPSQLKIGPVLEAFFTPTGNTQALCSRLIEAVTLCTALYRTSDGEADNAGDIHTQLHKESLFRMYTLLNRLLTLQQEGGLDVNTATFRRLLNKLLKATSIPFHGEPAMGLQIMGLLETRNLDFKHLLMLSAGEGKLPKTENEASFIPYNLRKAFGLTTIEHKNAVYAYYFYRLIQRAESITLLYNTSTDGMNRGEMSRFMMQYMVESGQKIDMLSLEASQKPIGQRIISIPKSQAVMERLHQLYDTAQNPEAYLSPSALNKYINCPLSFYFRYVAGIKENDEITADIDSAMFGSILHLAAELMYNQLTANTNVVNKSSFEFFEKQPWALEQLVDKAIVHEFFKEGNQAQGKHLRDGMQRIKRSVIVSLMKKIIQADKARAPFTYIGSEKDVKSLWTINTPRGPMQIKIGGRIDRLDMKDGTWRIVDYKTGASEVKNVSELGTLFGESERDGRIFQTLLYSSILCKLNPDEKISPFLFIIIRSKEEYDVTNIKINKTEVDDFRKYEEEFDALLTKKIEELFDPSQPFKQCEDRAQRCKYCEFATLCRVNIPTNK